MTIIHWRLAPLLLFGVLAVLFWRGLSLDPQKLPSSQLGQRLPSFELPVLDHPQQSLTPKTMQGQVVLLNVWASWCPACVQEQAFLMRLADQGIAVYGLNYKDETQDAQKWLEEWGNPYKLIGEDKLGKTAIDLGVYGAPETFLVDKQGIIRYRHIGIIDEQSWEKELLPRIRQLQKLS